MDILILGNGFDLAHGLKTKYNDFLNYCIEKNNRRILSPVNYETTFIDNIWLRHFITTCNNYGNNWIDLEEEIYNVVLSLNKTLKKLSGDNTKIVFPLIFSIQKDIVNFDFYQIIEYLKSSSIKIETDNRKYKTVATNDFSRLVFYIEDNQGFINFIYEQLRNFVKEFENYLTAEQEKVINEPKYSLRLNQNCVSLLNFNYTDTCEQLYKIKFDSNNCGIKTKAVYVHGKVNAKNYCNLVLGTHSFNNEQISVGFNLFKKHNQRHKYGTIEPYQELLKELKYPKKIYTPIFHVIGHSLDRTDHSILKHIFLAREKSIINIYYHDEISQEKLTNNITEIIGEDEVMARVRMIYQHDRERGILIPAKKTVVSE